MLYFSFNSIAFIGSIEIMQNFAALIEMLNEEANFPFPGIRIVLVFIICAGPDSLPPVSLGTNLAIIAHGSLEHNALWIFPGYIHHGLPGLYPRVYFDPGLHL